MTSPVDGPFCHLTPYRTAFGRQCVRTLICYSCQRDAHCFLFCSAWFPVEIRLFQSCCLSDRLSNPILFTFLIHWPILVLFNTDADALMVLSSTTVMNTGSQIEERDVINACSDEKISLCAQLFLGIRLYQLCCEQNCLVLYCKHHCGVLIGGFASVVYLAIMHQSPNEGSKCH